MVCGSQSRGSRQRINPIYFLFNQPILFIEGGMNAFPLLLQTHSFFFSTWAYFHSLSVSLITADSWAVCHLCFIRSSHDCHHWKLQRVPMGSEEAPRLLLTNVSYWPLNQADWKGNPDSTVYDAASLKSGNDVSLDVRQQWLCTVTLFLFSSRPERSSLP